MMEMDSLLYPPVEQKRTGWRLAKCIAASILGIIVVGTVASTYVTSTELDEDQTVFNLLTAPQWKTTSIFGSSRTTLKPLQARIGGVEIPNNKKIEYSLQSIYGIGPVLAKQILAATGISPDIRTRQLSEDQLIALRDEVNKGGYVIEGDLRREVKLNIARLQEIKANRGIRHRMNLPVRGQNTKNNARTRKGKKKIITGKK